jgi:hypothetical protein
MNVAKNATAIRGSQTSRALRKILRGVQRMETMRPLDINVQRLYRIADQVREAIGEAESMEAVVSSYPSYVTAAALPPNDEDGGYEEEK